jgi:hypothetical protein
VSVSSDINMHAVMDGFQAVARAPTVARGVVAERRPRMDTRQKIQGLAPQLALRAPQRPVPNLKGAVQSDRLEKYLVSCCTSSVASGSMVSGNRNVVFQPL